MHKSKFKGFCPDFDSVKLLDSAPESSSLSDNDALGDTHLLPTHPSDNSPGVCDSQLDCSLSGYDYKLPQERIAQNPAFPRDSARLLVVDSPTHHTHRVFHDLPELLKPGDLLVMNNTRVIPARLYGRKSTGALVEVLLLEERHNNNWLALVKPGKRLKSGAKIFFASQQGSKGEEEQGRRGPPFLF